LLLDSTFLFSKTVVWFRNSALRLRSAFLASPRFLGALEKEKISHFLPEKKSEQFRLNNKGPKSLHTPQNIICENYIHPILLHLFHSCALISPRVFFKNHQNF
jgi:hypothetical protein